jgi:hypothetical protein
MKTHSARWCGKAALLTSLLVTIAGCGRTTGTLTGKVWHKGKALSRGTVTLVSESGLKIQARISPNGSYRVALVPVGTARIAVDARGSGLPPVLVPRVPANWTRADDAGQGPSIPLIYRDADKSGLTCDVSGGEQTHDINLP